MGTSSGEGRREEEEGSFVSLGGLGGGEEVGK